ncbi:MAG: electron transport complex subunit RsxG [Saccharospirillum sp.]|nr:electron transport complex subunit RsxG [Saccharospirillum sp.]
MTDENPDNITLAQAIRRSAIGLGLFAIFTAGIIAVTQVLTAERIHQNERAFEARALFSLVPEHSIDNSLLDSGQPTDLAGLVGIDLLNLDRPGLWYQGERSGNVVAVILPLIAPDGYTEAIRAIMAVNAEGEVLGVRVVSHRETPGLGDQIERSKSDWILQFDQRSLTNTPPEEWQVSKDGGTFDAMTGATITARTLVRSVYSGLQFFERNRTLLLTPAPTDAEES